MDALLAALIAAGTIDPETAEILRRQGDIETAREWAELALTTAVQGALSAQQQRLLDLLIDTESDPTAGEMGAFWEEEDTLLYEALSPTISRIVTERATIASIFDGNTFAFSNGNAQRWAQTYYRSATEFGSIPNLNQTSRGQFADAFDQWVTGQLPGRRGLPDLITALTPTFGPTRAQIIGSTEVTRIFIEAQKAADADNPYVVGYSWRIAADERTCPICGPMAGKVRKKGEAYEGGLQIPAHPRCRCHESRETAGTLALAGKAQPPAPVAPAVVEAVAVEETATLGPSGTPVSSALKLPKRGAIAGPVKDAVAAIDSVHGDGVLPELPIVPGAKNMPQEGYYKFYAGTGQPVEIKIRNTASHMMNTTAHEVGHFLEVQGLLPTVNNTPGAVDKLNSVRDTFSNSAAVKRLNNLLIGRETITITFYNGATMQSGADATYLRYLMRDEEVWARAYAQYITVRSQHPTMLEELRKEQGNSYPVAWADDDFEPIATAIDTLFAALGWRK